MEDWKGETGNGMNNSGHCTMFQCHCYIKDCSPDDQLILAIVPLNDLIQ